MGHSCDGTCYAEFVSIPQLTLLAIHIPLGTPYRYSLSSFGESTINTTLYNTTCNAEYAKDDTQPIKVYNS